MAISRPGWTSVFHSSRISAYISYSKSSIHYCKRTHEIANIWPKKKKLNNFLIITIWTCLQLGLALSTSTYGLLSTLVFSLPNSHIHVLKTCKANTANYAKRLEFYLPRRDYFSSSLKRAQNWVGEGNNTTDYGMPGDDSFQQII